MMIDCIEEGINKTIYLYMSYITVHMYVRRYYTYPLNDVNINSTQCQRATLKIICGTLETDHSQSHAFRKV